MLVSVCLSLSLAGVGHNMSQADANSVAGESMRAGQTGTGCYKNHEHHMGRLQKEAKQGAGGEGGVITAAPTAPNILDLPATEDQRPGSPDYQTPVSGLPDSLSPYTHHPNLTKFT